MDKNGRFFVSIVCDEGYTPSVWDPYTYRQNEEHQTLSHFARVQRITVKSVPHSQLPFRPIEYRDIPAGNHLCFALEPDFGGVATRLPIVKEGELLIGTMRAYLGNVLVTPLASWIGLQSPIYFQVKSEFVVVSPHDQLPYFWLAYVRSNRFLEHLPLGSGGTRPRLQPSGLEQTPVFAPPLDIRRNIHEELQELAREQWENYSRTSAIIDSHFRKI